MSASFARKRSILQEQKYPQEVIMARWGRAERPVARFVAQGQSDLSLIDKEIETLLAETPDTEFKIQNRDLCVSALESFKLLSNQLDFKEFKRTLGPMQSMPIPINGVSVSVLPQVLLQGVTQKGTKVVGGIKFSFPKSHPLDSVSASFLSVLIHWHCEFHLPHLGKPDLRLCQAVDVPTATVFPPPKSYKQRRQQIEEACHEIMQRWPNIPSPS